MKELEELTMELVAAQERGDMEEWKKAAQRIAEMKGEREDVIPSY